MTGGSPAVITGIIDTGVDKDHPDLVQNIDFSKSASCESGAPVKSPAAWDDRNGHGTHTAGVLDRRGLLLPGDGGLLVHGAGSQQLDVTNNSYFADPWLYNCRNDKEQHAIWKAEQRAIRYAQQQGVTVVASIGNDSDDRAHPTVDVISPDFPPGEEEERRITNACVVVPVEVSGVIGVTATGNEQRKSSYSAYGVGVADIAAPGGDSFQVTPEAPNGRVLSTWPAEIPCTRMVQDPPPPPAPTAVYCYLQGTSMAGPHVAGVAALVVSRLGDADNPQNGKMRPGAVQQYVEKTADPQPCPTAAEMVFYEPFPRPDGEPQECQGGTGYNSWYGHGEANAFRAVTHDTSSR